MRKTEEYSITLGGENSAEKKRRIVPEKLNIFEVFETVIAALVVVTVLFTFFLRMFDVDGPSMKPTLEHNDKLVVSTVGYKAKVGDVVVISKTGDLDKPIVKRIIAVGGDTVDINFTTGVVTVNGTEENYTDELTSQQFDIAFPITVPEGSVFVLGDNRGNSLDSRSTRVGCVDERYIVGKVLFRFFPFGDWKVE